MPEKVLALARAFLSEPKFISLVGGHSSPSEFEHVYYLTSAQEKEKNLRIILETENPDSAIVFCNTKDDVRYVTAFLQRHGFDADQISGDLNQGARERAMSRIKAGELRILVATDVAARGIDISGLSHVISYTAPETPETYVHRTGRTGRAGQTGTAITFITPSEYRRLTYIKRVAKAEIKKGAIPTVETIIDSKKKRLKDKIVQSMELQAESQYIQLAEDLLALTSPKEALSAVLKVAFEEEFNQDPENEELLDIPTFLRRQAN